MRHVVQLKNKVSGFIRKLIYLWEKHTEETQESFSNIVKVIAARRQNLVMVIYLRSARIKVNYF